MSGGHEKVAKNLRVVGAPMKIRTEYLPNASEELYRRTDLLDPNEECCHDVTVRRIPSASVRSLRLAPKRQNKVLPSLGADPRICAMAFMTAQRKLVT